MTSSNPGQPGGTINRFTSEGTNHAEERPDLSGTSAGGINAVPGNPFYRVLALYLPWSVLVCFLPPALALIHRLLPGLPLPGLAVYLPALFVSAGVTVYLELLDPRTSHSGAHIRGAVLSILGTYLLSSILSLVSKLPQALREDPQNGLQWAARQFLPALGSIAAVLAALYLWVFIIRLRDLFRTREIFEFHLRRHRGEELRRVMLEDSGVMIGTETQVRSMTRHYGIQLGIVVILVLVCDILQAPLSVFQRILTMLVMTAAAVVFSLLNLFRQEQFFAGEGIAIPAPERRRRMGAGILFCTGAGILAALCALGSNLLPFSAVIAFLAWLARILSRPGASSPPLEMPRQEPAPAFNPQDMAQAFGIEETEPWPLWDYLPHIALALIIAAFLWFMVKPLFRLNRGDGKLPLILRFARLFRGAFRSLRLAVRNFFTSLRGGAGIRTGGPEEKLREMTGELLAGLSGARKRELRHSLSLFARLILWGERNHHTIWKPSMGPGEFCAVLARSCHEGGSLPPRPSPAVLASPPLRGQQENPGAASAPPQEAAPSGPPQRPRNPPAEETPPAAQPSPAMQATATLATATLATAILRCGEIFEEALYGPRLPDKETQREFRRLVEKITAVS
jgi:hypothetical protein